MTCPICGGQRETPWSSTCETCHLASFIPAWYAEAEQYRYDRTWGQWNATRKPQTGQAILDQPSGLRAYQFAHVGKPPHTEM